MNYYFCDACHYCFEADRMPDRCPDCGKTHWNDTPAVRPASEKEIADLEQRVADLEAQSALPEVYSNPERAKENALSLRQTRETLDAKYDLWAELSEA